MEIRVTAGTSYFKTGSTAKNGDRLFFFFENESVPEKVFSWIIE